MRLEHEIELGYCTNIHRGESWAETFDGLTRYTDEVRKRVAPDSPYGVGLRLGHEASVELAGEPQKRDEFREWLDRTNSYVFTVNGFPYGTFHGSRVKEQVYVPDWATEERLDYTLRLFHLLDEFAPEGEEISVSTLPGSFKEFITPENRTSHGDAMFRNLKRCAEEIDRIRQRSGRIIHLGMEPEPLGLFETTEETVSFFESLLEGESEESRKRILDTIGVNYDTCHLAIEYENPGEAIRRLRDAGIRISKIHLSSALRLKPEEEAVEHLGSFHDEVYLHQVIVRDGDSVTHRFRDLPEAMQWYSENPGEAGEEWRVHFHIPLHAEPESGFSDTTDHISGILELVSEDPGWCRHFEMETYTWEVLPGPLRARDVVDQLTREYEWCLGEFQRVGIARRDPRS